MNSDSEFRFNARVSSSRRDTYFPNHTVSTQSQVFKNDGVDNLEIEN